MIKLNSRLILITLLLSLLMLSNNAYALELNSQFNVEPSSKVITINRGSGGKFSLRIYNKYRYSKPSNFARIANTVKYKISVNIPFKTNSTCISEYKNALNGVKILPSVDNCSLEANEEDYITVYIDIPKNMPLQEYKFYIVFTKQLSKFGEQLSRKVIEIPVTLRVSDAKYNTLEYNASIDKIHFTVGEYDLSKKYSEKETIKYLGKVIIKKTIDDLKYVMFNTSIDTKYKYQPYVLQYNNTLYTDIVPNQTTYLYNVCTRNRSALNSEKYILLPVDINISALVDSISSTENKIILHTSNGDYPIIDTSNKYFDYIKQQLFSLSIYDKETQYTIKELLDTVIVPKQCIYDTQLQVILDVNNKGTYTLNPSVNSIVTRVDTSHQKINNATISTIVEPKSKRQVHQAIDLNATPSKTKLIVNTKAYLHENYSPVDYTLVLNTLNIRKIINTIELSIIFIGYMIISFLLISIYIIHVRKYRRKVQTSIETATSYLANHDKKYD